jgi:hypothetical protein
MAVVSITAANLRAGESTAPGSGEAGEALAIGDLLYRSDSDGLYYKAINSSEPSAKVVGMCCLTVDGIGDKVIFMVPGGKIEHSSGIWTKGQTYVVGDTGGTMMDAADIASEDYVTIVGVAESTTVLKFMATATGISG